MRMAVEVEVAVEAGGMVQRQRIVHVVVVAVVAGDEDEGVIEACRDREHATAHEIVDWMRQMTFVEISGTCTIQEEHISIRDRMESTAIIQIQSA